MLRRYAVILESVIFYSNL